MYACNASQKDTRRVNRVPLLLDSLKSKRTVGRTELEKICAVDGSCNFVVAAESIRENESEKKGDLRAKSKLNRFIHRAARRVSLFRTGQSVVAKYVVHRDAVVTQRHCSAPPMDTESESRRNRYHTRRIDHSRNCHLTASIGRKRHRARNMVQSNTEPDMHCILWRWRPLEFVQGLMKRSLQPELVQKAE